jgi:FKBP-type peptidyl-prolyl cis-trans isomerase
MDLIRLTAFILLQMLLLACGQENQVKVPPTEEELRGSLIDANRARVKMEDHEIHSYVKKHNLDMAKTGTGLRYVVYEEGMGTRSALGKTAVINYKLSLLDGRVCYSSEKDGTRGFTIGKGEIEKGMDEGILLMRVGDRAKFILPSHLAYGLAGDGIKIPSHAVILYDVTLIDVK